VTGKTWIRRSLKNEGQKAMDHHCDGRTAKPKGPGVGEKNLKKTRSRREGEKECQKQSNGVKPEEGR